MSDRFFRNINLLLRGNTSTLDCAGENLLKKTKCYKCRKQCDIFNTTSTISKKCKPTKPICFDCLVEQNKK